MAIEYNPIKKAAFNANISTAIKNLNAAIKKTGEIENWKFPEKTIIGRRFNKVSAIKLCKTSINNNRQNLSSLKSDVQGQIDTYKKHDRMVKQIIKSIGTTGYVYPGSTPIKGYDYEKAHSIKKRIGNERKAKSLPGGYVYPGTKPIKGFDYEKEHSTYVTDKYEVYRAHRKTTYFAMGMHKELEELFDGIATHVGAKCTPIIGILAGKDTKNRTGAKIAKTVKTEGVNSTLSDIEKKLNWTRTEKDSLVYDVGKIFADISNTSICKGLAPALVPLYNYARNSGAMSERLYNSKKIDINNPVDRKKVEIGATASGLNGLLSSYYESKLRDGFKGILKKLGNSSLIAYTSVTFDDMIAAIFSGERKRSIHDWIFTEGSFSVDIAMDIVLNPKTWSKYLKDIASGLDKYEW